MLCLVALLVVALVHTGTAQTTYNCQCGYFVIEQFGGQVGDAEPIPFRANVEQVSPDACNEPVAGNNTCKWICDQWGLDVTMNSPLGLCDSQVDQNSSEVGNAKCWGGLFCEGLYQDNRIPDDGIETSIRIFSRMPECADSTGHTEWNLGNYEYPEALCCNALGFYDSCYEACACVKADPNRYCECGVFTTMQFEVIDEDDTTEPLPFKMISDQVGDTPFSFCDNYLANAPNEECEAHCRPIGESYFSSFSLIDSAHNDYNVNEGITYGELYCNSLRSRRVFFDTYINTQLRIYKRAPLCGLTVTWNNLDPWEIHPERLCCNEDGVFEYPCPTSGEAEPQK